MRYKESTKQKKGDENKKVTEVMLHNNIRRIIF